MKSLFKGISKCTAFAAILVAVISCADKTTEEKNDTYIDIAGALGKGRVIPLSEIAEDVTVIPLETRDSILIADLPIVGSFVSYENGHIYLMDKTQTIWIFDKKGKFVNKFNRKGRGPGEFILASGIEVEPETGDIVVFVSDGKFYEYSKDGSFIRKTNSPKDDGFSTRISRYGYKVNGNLYFISSEAMPVGDPKEKNEKYSVCAVTFDSLSNLKAKIFFPQKASDTIPVASQSAQQVSVVKGTIISAVTPNASCFRYRDNIRIRYEFDNIITTFNETAGHDTAYIINFGEFAPTRDYFSNPHVYDVTSEVISVNNIMESDNYLFFSLNLRGLAHNPSKITETLPDGTKKTRKTTGSYALFNKKSGVFTLMDRPAGGNKKGFPDDISGGTVFWPKYISSEDNLVSYFSALDFIEYAENNIVPEKIKKIAAKLDENDNPVIVLVKLKN